MKNLKKLREENGLSRKDLGEILGTAEQTIDQYESGSLQPDFQMLMKLAEFFHTSVDYLIGYADAPVSEYPKCIAAEHGNTIAKRREHLTMYRSLSPGMQRSLDSFLENLAADDEDLEFRRARDIRL